MSPNKICPSVFSFPTPSTAIVTSLNAGTRPSIARSTLPSVGTVDDGPRSDPSHSSAHHPGLLPQHTSALLAGVDARPLLRLGYTGSLAAGPRSSGFLPVVGPSPLTRLAPPMGAPCPPPLHLVGVHPSLSPHHQPQIWASKPGSFWPCYGSTAPQSVTRTSPQAVPLPSLFTLVRRLAMRGTKRVSSPTTCLGLKAVEHGADAGDLPIPTEHAALLDTNGLGAAVEATHNSPRGTWWLAPPTWGPLDHSRGAHAPPHYIDFVLNHVNDNDKPRPLQRYLYHRHPRRRQAVLADSQ